MELNLATLRSVCGLTQHSNKHVCTAISTFAMAWQAVAHFFKHDLFAISGFFFIFSLARVTLRTNKYIRAKSSVR